MAWIKIDDSMVDHPKIEPLSDAAFRWLHKGLSYANRFLTNGQLPPVFIEKVPVTVVTELTTIRDGQKSPVWQRDADGIRIHDFTKLPTLKSVGGAPAAADAYPSGEVAGGPLKK